MPQARQDLIIYKRHAQNCDVHKTKIKVDKRRFFMDCDCMIWIEGRTPDGDLVPRQSTGFRDLGKAEAFRNSFLKKIPSETYGAPLSECVTRYMESRKRELAPKTLNHHRIVLDRLKTFCEAKGKLYMGNLDVDLIEDFKTFGFPDEMKDTSRATQFAKVICFLREAFRRGWIKEALAEKILPFSAVYEQKDPYTEDQIKLIFEEALKLNGGTIGFAGHPKTFRLLLELMLETGMRVGDALLYDPRSVQRGEHLWCYVFSVQKRVRKKRAKFHEVYLTDELKTAIDGCEWLSPQRPFLYGSFKNESYLANEVYERMKTVGVRCGVPDCRPHRLRDTFAIGLLIDGVAIDEVSRLLGHSSVKVTEAYYAKWILARKRRLEGRLAQALGNACNRGVRNP